MANLTQLRKLETLDGFLLVDKPVGIAFSTVVKTVKRKFSLVKVGHGGSLDASASGLFVLLINDANKFTGEVMGADRSWEGTLRIGIATDTGDMHGRAERTAAAGEIAAALSDPEKVAAALKAMKGDVFQTEPRFCAVRKEGSGEYSIADTGEHSQFLAHVYRFETDFAAAKSNDDATRSVPFSLAATKGLLVRALAADFGAALGCGAALESCRRTRIGRFDVADAVPFEKILDTEIGDFAALVTPIARALRG